MMVPRDRVVQKVGGKMVASVPPRKPILWPIASVLEDCRERHHLILGQGFGRFFFSMSRRGHENGKEVMQG
jgi:hypothetical protein